MDKREDILDDDFVIEITDDKGNVFYYVEEMIIPVDGENFALLIEVKDEAHGEGCDCGCCDDEVVIAKVIINEHGEEEFIEPTDEEFEKVQAIYDKLLDEEA